MEELLKQIEKSVNDGQYYVALMACLTLPDICGALGSKSGRAQRNRYIDWFNTYIKAKYSSTLDGENCYVYRCALLHQGKSKHKDLGYERILFVEPCPRNNIFHNNIFNGALQLDIKIFTGDIISGVRSWLADIKNNRHFITNYEHFLKKYNSGLPQYGFKGPVIA